jgi:hypothetical protein
MYSIEEIIIILKNSNLEDVQKIGDIIVKYKKNYSSEDYKIINGLIDFTYRYLSN